MSDSADTSAGGIPYAKIALGLIALGALIALGRFAGGAIPVFAKWVEGLGILGPIVFIAGYAVAVVAFVPASLLTLAAGAIFGIVEGSLYVFMAAILGSCGAFLVARYLARSAVESRIENHPKFAAIDRAVGDEGRKIVFLLRLSPVFPFNLLNYALGLTRVGFFDYAIAGVGMIPGTILYVYLGSVIGDVAAVAGGAEVEGGAGGTVLLVAGLIATAIVTVFVTRIARRALQEASLD